MAGTVSEREKVLLPATFSPACYTCVRSLGKSGVYTIVASEYEDVPAGGSRFCDEQIRICSPEDDLIAYKNALRRIARRQNVRTILPLRPSDPYVLAKYQDEFERHTSVPVPSMETISIVNDRMKLYDNAVEAEVPVPETWCIDEFDQWDDEFIIKSRYNLLTAEQVPSYQSNESGIEKGIVHVESGAKPNRNSIITEMNHKPIVQKYVRNDAQYVFGALYDDGEPQVTFQHRQIRGDSYTGGGGVYRESMYDPDLEAVGRRLLEHLDWHGIACIEFAKDSETGEYKLLEINPRFWQSLSCAVRAGADFPTYYWMQATGRTEAIDPGYVNGIRSHYLYGEICHLSSVLFDSSVLVDRPSLPIKTWKILSSCLMTPRFDVVHIDDPVPTVRSLRRVLRNRLMK